MFLLLPLTVRCIWSPPLLYFLFFAFIMAAPILDRYPRKGFWIQRGGFWFKNDETLSSKFHAREEGKSLFVVFSLSFPFFLFHCVRCSGIDADKMMWVPSPFTSLWGGGKDCGILGIPFCFSLFIFLNLHEIRDEVQAAINSFSLCLSSDRWLMINMAIFKTALSWILAAIFHPWPLGVGLTRGWSSKALRGLEFDLHNIWF